MTDITAHTTETEAGPVITASILRMMAVPTVKDDCIQEAPTLTLAIALNEQGEWIPIYETGGDWFCISEDDNDAALSIGCMDGSNSTEELTLDDGIDTLLNLSFKIRELDRANEALGEVADYVDAAAVRANDEAWG